MRVGEPAGQPVVPEIAQEAVSQDVETGQTDSQHEVGFISHARAPASE